MSGEEPTQGQPRHGSPWVGTTLYWERTLVSSSHGLEHPEIPYPWLGNVQNVDRTAAKTNPSTWNGYGAGIYDQRLSLPGRVVGAKALDHGRAVPSRGKCSHSLPSHGNRCTEPWQSRGTAVGLPLLSTGRVISPYSAVLCASVQAFTLITDQATQLGTQRELYHADAERRF